MSEQQKQEDIQSKQNMIAIAFVSVLYALMIQITKNLNLIQSTQGTEINLAVFVPAIAGIIFGKVVGGGAGAGGQLLGLAGGSLLGQSEAALTEIGNIINIVSDFVGGWTVGMLTKRPEGMHWDTLVSRFKAKETWGRVANNTLGALVGTGLASSFIDAFGNAAGEGNFLMGSPAFVEEFFLTSIFLLIFVPPTLILYELGDVFMEVRALRVDQQLRKVFYNTVEEKVVVIAGVDLTGRAFTNNVWTPMKIRFRNIMETPQSFKIEAVSTARLYPPHDSTKELQPGELWEQNFYVLPAQQAAVDMRIRISPQLFDPNFVDELMQNHTILEINGKSYNPQKGTFMLAIFGVINSLFVGASIVYSNLITIMSNVNEAMAMIQSSWSLLTIVTVLEVAIFVPIMIIIRRAILALPTDADLKLSFGMDFSAHKYQQAVEEKIRELLEQFAEEAKLFIQVCLITATVISVIILGIEGFRVFTVPGYTVPGVYMLDIMIIAAGVFIIWVIGIRGPDILREAGFIQQDKYTLEKGAVAKFDPISDFQRGLPNEILITVKNPTENPGVRVRLIGFDTVSPPLVELRIPPRGKGTFKASITPIDLGKRDILAVSYPLFDASGKYINADKAEPFSDQHINYIVLPPTKFGLSPDQMSKLKKLGIAVIGLLILIFTASQFLESILENFPGLSLEFLTINAPFLIALQVPFIYGYFYLQNSWKTQRFDVMSLIGATSTSVEISSQMDNTLAVEIGDSIGNEAQKAVRAQIDSFIGDYVEDNVANRISVLIEEQIRMVIEQKGKAQIDSDVRSEAKDLLFTQIEYIIEKEFGSEITQKVNEAIGKAHEIKTTTQEMKSEIGAEFKETIKQVKDKEAEVRDLDDEVHALNDEIGDTLKRTVGVALKQKIEIELKEQIKKEIKLKVQGNYNKKIATKLNKTIQDQLKNNILKGFDKKLYEDLKKQLDEGLIDTVFDELEKQLDENIKSQLAQKLEEQVHDRRLLRHIASELDDTVGGTYLNQFEDVIGSATENEVGQIIRQGLAEKIEREMAEKLKKFLRIEITKHFKKNLKKTIKVIVETQIQQRISGYIEKAVTMATEEGLEQIMNETSDKLIDSTIDRLVAEAVSIIPVT